MDLLDFNLVTHTYSNAHVTHMPQPHIPAHVFSQLISNSAPPAGSLSSPTCVQTTLGKIQSNSFEMNDLHVHIHIHAHSNFYSTIKYNKTINKYFVPTITRACSKVAPLIQSFLPECRLWKFHNSVTWAYESSFAPYTFSINFYKKLRAKIFTTDHFQITLTQKLSSKAEILSLITG